MTRVLWVDPGKASGVAYFDSATRELELAIVSGGVTGFKEWWLSFGPTFDYDVFGYESFELEEGTHGIDVNDPNEVIGFLKGLGVPLVKQRRMERGKKALISDAVLKRAGLYPPRGAVGAKHQVEALRHALKHLVHIRDMPTIRLLHPKEG